MKEMWDKRFGAIDYAYGKKPNDFLVEQSNEIPRGGRVLCIAEGEGRNAVFLAKLGYQVSAVDISKAGRDKALKLAREAEVEINFEVADVAEYSIGRSQWDGIVSIFAHMPAAVRKSIHANISSALKPNGVFIMEAYGPEQINRTTGGPKSPDLLFDLKKVQAEIIGLEAIHVWEGERDIVEGAFHSGLGVVSQIVARKS